MTAETATQRVFIYKRFERFWHWCQAILIFLLALTGFEIHGSFELLGWEKAYILHQELAVAFMVLIAFAIFWHFTTGEWRQYIPTANRIGDMIKYYTHGIFVNAPYPWRKTEISKLNPLQRLTYLGLKILVIPVQVGSGLLYYFYFADPVRSRMDGELGTIAAVHTLGAFILMAFVIAHVYLTTTGKAPLANIRAMVTGWEEVENEE